MSEAIDMVSRALRGKLLRDGVRSLTDAEWHLLRISHVMNAAEDGTLDRVLGDSPLAELLAVADGFDAIGTPGTARKVRDATEQLAAANDPGLGLRRAETVSEVTRALDAEITRRRIGIEQRLIDFAFRQRDGAAEGASAG